MDGLKKIIAKNIQELRITSSLTQAELASRLNYSDKAVSKWERGESVPDVQVLKMIAELFEVTVDYLLTDDHADSTDLPKISKKIIRRNRMVITLLATSVVWLIATIAFVIFGLALDSFSKTWLAYVVAVPVSCIVLLVFNSIWGNGKLNYLIISLLLWSTLLTVCLLISMSKIWILFVIGIPAQVMILISAGFIFKKADIKTLHIKNNQD
ncbi:MAG: helix-turn-helix transcriptional regulator [Clostridia bacterium]|nr:helix-turn-helix transcriptional regulator [Clostridia bacterium]